MKTYLYILLIGIFAVGCVSEEGPVGPTGPQGPQGPEGPAGESSFVFEFENLNFTAPDYEIYLDYPADFEGFDSDVALVYLLWGTEEVDGTILEIWRQLPQTIIDERGSLIYNFDFTKNDARLFLNASYSLDNLVAIDTDNWIARVVVVPGNFWADNRRPEFIEYNDLKEELGLPEMPVHQNIEQRR